MLIGLTGYAGSGKDTLADALVKLFGFRKFSYSDELRNEVIAAFPGVTLEHLISPVWKEVPSNLLILAACRDKAFVEAVITAAYVDGTIPTALVEDQHAPLSPRQVQQWWGTEYRRKQDPDYWVKLARTAEKLRIQPANWVYPAVRFVNEVNDIHNHGGTIINVRRPGVGPVNTHISDNAALPSWGEVVNDGTVADMDERAEALYQALTRKANADRARPAAV